MDIKIKTGHTTIDGRIVTSDNEKMQYLDVNGYGTGWRIIPPELIDYLAKENFDIVNFSIVDKQGYYLLAKRYVL